VSIAGSADMGMGGVLTVTCNSEGIDNSFTVPSVEQLAIWANKAVRETTIAAEHGEELELSVAFIDSQAMRDLNKEYRGIDKPTNVLTFSALEDLVDPTLEVAGLLGDIVICPEVIHSEAVVQGKLVEHHFAHMLVHGVLHLGGMDHHVENEAQAMEQAEIQILSSLDIPDPYNAVFKKPT